MKSRICTAGRDPERVPIRPGLVTEVGSTEVQARTKQQELDELLPMKDSLPQLSQFVGRACMDIGGSPLRCRRWRRWMSSPVRRGDTPGFFGSSMRNNRPWGSCWVGSLREVGTPEQIADRVAQ